MAQFTLARTLLEDGRFETTKVLGVFKTLDVAKAYANELIKEIRDDMEWEDEAPAWAHAEDRMQWSTTDFPVDMGMYHLFTVDMV